MKKCLVTACLALFGAGAFAQTTQGTMVVSGSVGLTGQGYETQDSGWPIHTGNNTSFYVSPHIGTFYRDGVEVGIGAGFSFSRNSIGNDGEESTYKNYMFSLSPYVRKYFPITEKLFFTAGASAGAGFGRRSSRSTPDGSFTNTSKEFSFGINASPGLVYFATERLGFSIDIGGANWSRRTTTAEQTDYKTTETSFRASFSPSSSTIGIRYIFNR